jgi:hypothetical protein
MANTEQSPNPEDWTDTEGAARLIGRSRPTVYDMVERGLLVRYRIGALSLFWVPECREVGAALARVRAGARRG